VIDLEETGNKMDLFKAIFENSDDEDSEEEETDKPPKATPVEPLRNTSPPRGIFANLDLDALSNNRKPKESPAPKEAEAEPEDPLAYGPKLPQVKFTNVSLPQPKILTVTVDNSSSSSSSSDDGEWVEKSSKSSKKHSKKSHKKSKKKEKHKKHKKKKKKSK
jgi:G patch domain-containing protein 1